MMFISSLPCKCRYLNLLQQVYNFTFAQCSQYWLEIMEIRQSIEQYSPSHRQTFNRICFFKYSLNGLKLVIAASTLTIIILVLTDENQGPRAIISANTLMASAFFIYFCIKIWKNLQQYYIVSENYQKKLKMLIFCLIFLSVVRVFYNFCAGMSSISGGLKEFKKRVEISNVDDAIIPNHPYNWYYIELGRAIFTLIFTFITDIIPIWAISKLFAPKISNKASLHQVEDQWDVDSQSDERGQR